MNILFFITFLITVYLNLSWHFLFEFLFYIIFFSLFTLLYDSIFDQITRSNIKDLFKGNFHWKKSNIPSIKNRNPLSATFSNSLLIIYTIPVCYFIGCFGRWFFVLAFMMIFLDCFFIKESKKALLIIFGFYLFYEFVSWTLGGRPRNMLCDLTLVSCLIGTTFLCRKQIIDSSIFSIGGNFGPLRQARQALYYDVHAKLLSCGLLSVGYCFYELVIKPVTIQALSNVIKYLQFLIFLKISS